VGMVVLRRDGPRWLRELDDDDDDDDDGLCARPINASCNWVDLLRSVQCI